MNAQNECIAVVAGSDHQNTLGVIRSLGEAGIRAKAVIVSHDSTCSTASSKYIDEAYVVRPEELIATLVKIGDDIGFTVPLIPCGDDTAVPIALAYDRLKHLYHLSGSENGKNTLRLMKKSEMLEAARAAGLHVPEWVTLQEDSFCSLESCCRSLRFPCIVKPVGLKPGGVFEFHILQNREELSTVADYIEKNCKSVIIQEYINKTAEFGINACRMYHSGETVFCGVIEKKRFSQVSLGSTTAGSIVQDMHGLCVQAKKFVEAIDYRGIFDMEFITDGKEFYFVEMNFRNGGYGYACTKAGRNFPALWACEAQGKPISAFLCETVGNVFFINESADLQNVRVGNISIFTWLWDVLRAKAHMYINFRDMKPLLKKIMK